jgi:hypothetical protein
VEHFIKDLVEHRIKDLVEDLVGDLIKDLVEAAVSFQQHLMMFLVGHGWCGIKAGQHASAAITLSKGLSDVTMTINQHRC